MFLLLSLPSSLLLSLSSSLLLSSFCCRRCCHRRIGRYSLSDRPTNISALGQPGAKFSLISIQANAEMSVAFLQTKWITSIAVCCRRGCFRRCCCRWCCCRCFIVLVCIGVNVLHCCYCCEEYLITNRELTIRFIDISTRGPAIAIPIIKNGTSSDQMLGTRFRTNLPPLLKKAMLYSIKQGVFKCTHATVVHLPPSLE